MSWAESQATKDGCNTLPEMEIGGLVHGGVEEFVMFFFPLYYRFN